jgi:hypothetical protein
MTEITLVMDFGGSALDEEAKTGIADPWYSPEIHFAFQLYPFRKSGALAKE